MPDIHIEDFYKDAAKILLQLFDEFPRKSTVFVEDVSGQDTPDEFGLHSDRHLACFACMLWLQDEGFMRFESTIRQEAVDQAVLTQKAFLKLSRITLIDERATNRKNGDLSDKTDGLDAADSNARIIRNALKESTSTQIAVLIEKVLFS